MDEPNTYAGVERAPQFMNGKAGAAPMLVAIRALEVTGRLHDAVVLLGALVLFVWLAADPHWLRLCGAMGFSLVALALRYLRGHGGA